MPILNVPALGQAAYRLQGPVFLVATGTDP
jgi:hypothetical protein